ncbi:MAG: protein kinase domain-containing protein [Fimbriimonadaceae bacterium]
MACTVVRCHESANHSEETALRRVEAVLNGRPGEEWVVLANLMFSPSPDRPSDELDLVCIGTRGVVAIEVKHWQIVTDEDRRRLEREAERISMKARRLSGSLKAKLRQSGLFVSAGILLTKAYSRHGEAINGVPIHDVSSISLLFDSLSGQQLSGEAVRFSAETLHAQAAIRLREKIRRLAGYVNLEHQSSTQDGFHRVFRGVEASTREPVVLHLYDLSVGADGDLGNLARRECETLQRLQKSSHVPYIRETIRDVPGYEGEMLYFVLMDPCAPTVAKRKQDKAWSWLERLSYATKALEALQELYELGESRRSRERLVLRTISPNTLLVANDNLPVFSDLQLSRLPGQETIVRGSETVPQDSWIAPEIRTRGWQVASQASDIFALCTVLKDVFNVDFDGRSAEDCDQVVRILDKGCREEPGERALDPRALAEELKSVGASAETTATADKPEARNPSVEFWSEGTTVRFKNRRFRVVSRLGSGGVGHTFKVESLEEGSDRTNGTFVAKVFREGVDVERVLKAYRRVQSASSDAGLATVHEVADAAEPNGIGALMEWVEGPTLDSLSGRLGEQLDTDLDQTLEALLRGWIEDCCRALARLHSQGLVHGDISPRNLIYARERIRIIDYDLVTWEGEAAVGSGCPRYASPESSLKEGLFPRDDLYALAASLFEAVFGVQPFPECETGLDKSRGLDWTKERAAVLGALAEFFRRATDPDPNLRFQSAMEALAWLRGEEPIMEERTKQVVPWLTKLLTVYPGSVHGNVETRGLDSEFAEKTYVPTELEDALREDLQRGGSLLVILCGNAGDGKTALLQSVAKTLGGTNVRSEDRVWTFQSADGRSILINFDGAAAWKEKSSDELLDELFEPFLHGEPEDRRVHLLAINDGRLLEWLHNYERAKGRTQLTETLLNCLAADDDPRPAPSHIQFISLNHRSLVGGVNERRQTTQDGFVDRLVRRMLGGDDAPQTWEPCKTCTAWGKCPVGPVAHRLIASYQETEESRTEDARRGQRIRERLTEALQLVHQKGETHITVRELRGALSYILFGTMTCEEVHEAPSKNLWHYFERAFDPESPDRQGALLRELTLLDPALEAHPLLDRWVVGRSSQRIDGAGPVYPGLPLSAARRRAYFEWLPEEIERVTGWEEGLGLAGGEHLRSFHEASLRDADQNKELCGKLCRGISKLEELPEAALRRKDRVPLRLIGRNPTETIFWIEKKLERFRLEPDWPPTLRRGLPVLPNRLRLVYRYAGGGEEILSMGYGLFHTLLAVGEGEQLGERLADDLYANLKLFVQRLSMEDEREWYAWHPRGQDEVLRLAVEMRDGRQVICCENVEEEA